MSLDEAIRRIREILDAGRWPDGDRELTQGDRDTLEWNLDLAIAERARARARTLEGEIEARARVARQARS